MEFENKKKRGKSPRGPVGILRQNDEDQSSSSSVSSFTKNFLAFREENLKKSSEAIERGKQSAKSSFDYLGKHFRASENPIFAWEAYLICRNFQYDVPEWVLQEIDKVSFVVHDLLNEARINQDLNVRSGDEQNNTKVVDSRKFNNRLLAAMGFNMLGRGNHFVSFFENEFMELGEKVHASVKDGLAKTYAAEEVANEHGLSRATVIKYYEKFLRLKD